MTGKLTWKYQALEEEGEFMVAVVYERDGKVEGWSKSKGPYGGSRKDLIEDIRRMLDDVTNGPVFEAP